MGLFKRKKKQRTQPQINRAAQQKRLSEEVSQEAERNRKDIQHYIINCCEQIIEAKKELEEEKAEYRIVSDYLNDIQTLEELPDEDLAEIHNAAENVHKLDRLRDEYQNAEKKISDSQFAQMQQEEDKIPGAILRLQTTEAYQATVKKDMNYLEGEKTEWHYNKLELIHQQKILKLLSFVLFGVFAMSVVILIVLQAGFYQDTRYAWIFVLFAAAVSGFCIFIKMTSNQTEIKRSEVNMNHAIELLNKIKFKYVNVTNAVDYAREKYRVKNSYELNYVLEQYLNEVKEREKFEKTNQDLQYFNDKLVGLLKRYRLYDAEVWINRSQALVDKNEMVEVKHNLIVRRQKLRSRIEFNSKSIRERRSEIDSILKKQNINTPEIRGIIDSIDHLRVG